jgi:membrane protease YdiL (CAAX protease family)
MPSWITTAFLGPERRLRNGWWLAAFLGVLAILLFPTIIASAHLGHDVTVLDQTILILLATIAVQAMRRKPLWEVTGRLNFRWALHLVAGAGLGAALMLVPALFLWSGGWVAWRPTGAEVSALMAAVLLMAGVAFAEELLFRGVLFQRLIDGVGVWPAQLIVAAFFVLTHLNNPGMEGATRIWAGVNIFAASLLFGLAYVRAKSLALPIGLHFMANVTQGVILGFGVSGNAEPSLLAPEFSTQNAWLTGGSFGLEASLPGLIAVVGLLFLLAFRRRE